MKKTDTLSLYRHKRDFKRTAEPSGKVEKKSGFSYLIQKHEASRLHYDFRLELDGVLKSWAVPKGPSYDPDDKRLAMQVEDHPVDYGTFEGTIPKGQYGGGTVMLWDTGTWEPVGDPREGLSKGKLVFRLHGKRLKGEWTLVRTFSREKGGNKWLLIKHKDAFVKRGGNEQFLAKNHTSIVSRRKMEAIAGASGSVWKNNKKESRSSHTNGQESASKVSVKVKNKDSHKSAAAKLPSFTEPQLATLTSSMPSGDNWVHEIKFDGYRIVAHVSEGHVNLYSRNGNDWTNKFSSISQMLGGYKIINAIFDGEVVVSDPSGKSNFSALKEALTAGDTDHLQYYMFDLLFFNGQDVRKLTLIERKKLLKDIISRNQTRSNNRRLIYSDHFQNDTDKFLQSVCQMHLEGAMSKRADAPYMSGRTKVWLKTKCHTRQEFVIGGYTHSTAGGTGIGALLLGYFDKKKFVYAGRVGTGFTSESSAKIRRSLEKLKRKGMPYQAVTALGRKGAIWVEPKLVCEVEFSEWTPDGHLRHPSFQGMREDKLASAIVREVPIAAKAAAREAEKEVSSKPAREKSPKAVGHATKKTTLAKAEEITSKTTSNRITSSKTSGEKVDIGGVWISHPDRIIYPNTKITKLQLAKYYLSVADYIMPYIKDRPLSVLRCPEGIGQACFFQRHVGLGRSPDVHEVSVTVNDEARQYMTIHSFRGLISLAQWGVIELHPWECTADHLDRPDRLIFDLDPDPSVSWSRLIEGAKDVRDRLHQIGMDSFLKTTGGKGLHLVVPIAPIYDWKTIKSFARAVATTITDEKPDHYIATMSKAARKGKIFIDYLRNDVTSTAVAPFSVRARPGATVSTPLFWEELVPSLKLSDFTMETVLRRLKVQKKDPWGSFHKSRQKIGKKFLDALK